jgi:Glycosyltransferase family 92
VDVQSLIQIAGLQVDFWSSNPRGDPRVMGRKPPSGDRGQARPYLSVCAIYRDEGPYLREWIEFHRLVGVERFFLYDNLSEDDHLDVLAPYLEDGTVTIQRWPVFDPQVPAYNDCLRWQRHATRWIAFIDVDEFLFSPTGRPLPEVLADYEAWPGVAVAWAGFGTGGHRTRPPGLVIENYLRRVEHEDRVMNMKSVVDPVRVIRFLSAHHCAYPYLSAVDENHVPVERHTLIPPSFARLRLNHYHFKSEEEYVAKFERWQAIGRRRKIPTAEDLERLRKDEDENAVTDETILMYLPALREALAAREQARPVATQQH